MIGAGILASIPRHCHARAFLDFCRGEFTMVTRRDLVVASLVFVVLSAAFAWAESSTMEVMRSKVFDFQELDPQATDKGQYRQICMAATATLDQLEAHITTLNPGLSSHEPHQHPNEEIVILTEGELEVYQNGDRRRIGPGSIMFMASNEFHAVTNVGDKPATYYVINWHSPGMLKNDGE
jgi:XRE family transcriptional regulator, regulator of sulfur utilization